MSSNNIISSIVGIVGVIALCGLGFLVAKLGSILVIKVFSFVGNKGILVSNIIISIIIGTILSIEITLIALTLLSIIVVLRVFDNIAVIPIFAGIIILLITGITSCVSIVRICVIRYDKIITECSSVEDIEYFMNEFTASYKNEMKREQAKKKIYDSGMKRVTKENSPTIHFIVEYGNK